MKNNTCKVFMDMLNTLDNKGIRTREELKKHPELYNAFWFAVEQFVSFALSSKTSKKNKDGEITCGNAYKIKTLVCEGVTTKEELRMDCTLKIICKLDVILKKYPVEKQYNTCYIVCNNCVIDHLRKLPPKCMNVVHLEDTVNGKRVSPEDAGTYQDFIGDSTYDGATYCERKETIHELKKVLKEKKLAERAAERAEIVEDIKLLSKKPAQILAHIACEHLGLKPRELAARIVESGIEVTYADILSKAAKKVGLENSELISLVKDAKPLEAKDFHAETNERKIIAEQISRLKDRANHKLNK